jgi:peptidyl-prolyl cis-trans isomerase C
MFRALPFLAAAATAAALTVGAHAQNAPAPDAAKPAAATPAKEAAPNGNVAVVNGTPIKRSELEMVIRQIKQPDSPELRKALTQKLVELEVLSQEAKRRKLMQDESVKFRVDNAARQTLIQALIADELEKHKATDEQVKAEYDKEVAASAGDKEYKVHHILVGSEAEAKDIIAKLDKGAKFEDLAKGTKDVGSAANGGEMDWASPASYVKPFSEAMVKLEKGKYTEAPVQSQFGWHVIRLDDTRPITPPPFDQVKSHLVENMQQKQIKDFVDGLVKKANVK